MERVVDGTWTPVWWEPELWPGSRFYFTATLHNCPPGAITGGVMFLDGREFPVSVSHGRIQAEVPAGVTGELAHGGSARLYLDTASGRVLWLAGTITQGGAQ